MFLNGMNTQFTEIERQAIRLPAKARAQLADRLLASLDDTAITEIDLAWIDEAERRFKSYTRGERKGVSAAAALRKARKAIAR